jgi:hypothetical protein
MFRRENYQRITTVTGNLLHPVKGKVNLENEAGLKYKD